jgi:hypothetical protein
VSTSAKRASITSKLPEEEGVAGINKFQDYPHTDRPGSRVAGISFARYNNNNSRVKFN